MPALNPKAQHNRNPSGKVEGLGLRVQDTRLAHNEPLNKIRKQDRSRQQIHPWPTKSLKRV